MKQILKYLYWKIPCKQGLFSAFKWLNLPKSITKHLNFKSVIKIKIDKQTSFKMMHYGFQLENELFWYGINGWEKESLNIWAAYCKKSHIIIDIGANTGIYSLIANAVNPQARIFAFEPVKRVFDKLEHNIQLNSFNVSAKCFAIASENGTQNIWDFNLDHQYGASLVPPETEDAVYQSYPIPTITLDSFIEQNNIQKIDLIKIDVESYEPEVLRGYIKNIALHKPIFLIEILHTSIGRQVQDILEDSIKGYKYYFIDEKRGLIQTDNIIRHNNYCYNYLLIHEDNQL